MEKKNIILYPKEIYQTIKEKPYRDGEVLIWKFVNAFCKSFYEWENRYSGNPPLAKGYSDKIVHQYFLKNIDIQLLEPLLSERTKTIDIIVSMIEQMQDEGHSFPDNFIKRVKGCKYKVE